MGLDSEHRESIVMARPGQACKYCFQKVNIRATIFNLLSNGSMPIFHKTFIFFSPELLDKAHVYPQSVRCSVPHTVTMPPAAGETECWPCRS